MQRKPLVIGSKNIPTVLETGDELPDSAMPTNPVQKGLQAMRPPVGASADRNGAPTAGDFRYNSTLGCHEGFTPDGWVPMDNCLVATYRGNVSPTSGTTRIPFDNTVPLVTEGTQLWSKQVTPKFVGSILTIEFDIMVDCSTGTQSTTITLFRDNTLIAFSSSASTGGGGLSAANRGTILSLKVNDTTTSLTAVTYQVRVGNESSGTWYAGRPAANSLGGTNNSGWKIDEVLP